MIPRPPSRRGYAVWIALRAAAVVAVVLGVVLIVAERPAPSGDAQPPTPPSGLSVGAVTCRSAMLVWAASTDDTGVAFYDVYKDGQLVTSVGGATREYALTLVPGVPWGIYVNARDAAGNVSQASETLPVSPPQCGSDTEPPSAPDGLVTRANANSVVVGWSASSDDAWVMAYDVFRDGARVGTVPTGTGDPLTFTDVALPSGASLRYQVLARDQQGNASPRSKVSTVTTGTGCLQFCAIEQVAKDTDVVWGLVELPDGTVLYARRDAHEIVRLDPRTGRQTTAGVVPGAVSTDGEGGLLGIAIAPTFAQDGWLYIFHSSQSDNRIVRMRYRDGALDISSLKVLVSGIPRNKFHNGGRLRFGPDGKLYAATGDGQNPDRAQDVHSLAGKVLRLNPDGTVPTDNPFGNLVWSYGHRNPQGLAFDSRGRLWEQEFGNSVMDDTNLIVKGGNYGWPACEGTRSDPGRAPGCGTPGYLPPKHTYQVAAGSCSGIAIVRDVLYVACLRGSRLYRAEIHDDTLTNVTQVLLGTYGRLRTVEPGAGGLWLTTSNGGDKDSIAGNSDAQIMRIALPAGTA